MKDILQKRALRNISKSSFLAHTQPICKSLKTLLFNDILTLQCLKFYYKFKNNMLPQYFYDSQFLVENTNNTNYFLRKTVPLTSINQTNYMPALKLPKTKKHLSENRLFYYLPYLFSTSTFPDCVRSKISTHSLRGVSLYFRNFILQNYSMECAIPNCFSCLH